MTFKDKKKWFSFEMSFVLAQSYAYACAYARACVDVYVANFAGSFFNLLSRSLCLCLRLVKTRLSGYATRHYPLTTNFPLENFPLKTLELYG